MLNFVARYNKLSGLLKVSVNQNLCTNYGLLTKVDRSGHEGDASRILGPNEGSHPFRSLNCFLELTLIDLIRGIV